MATWTDPTSIKTGVTNGKPGIGVGGFGYNVADNLQYLYDQLRSLGVQSDQGIHDNFTEDSLNVQGAAGTDPYTWDTGGAGTLALDGAPDHWAHFQNGAGNLKYMAAGPYKMRFDLDRDHTIYMEARHKMTQGDTSNVWLIGFQDASLTTPVTQDNIIAFIQDSTAQKYKGRVVKATVGQDVATGLGLGAASWVGLRIEITFSGGTKKVEFFTDTGSGMVSAGSTTDTTKIPVVKMRPFIGFSGGGGTRDNYIDVCHFDWMVEPRSN